MILYDIILYERLFFRFYVQNIKAKEASFASAGKLIRIDPVS